MNIDQEKGEDAPVERVAGMRVTVLANLRAGFFSENDFQARRRRLERDLNGAFSRCTIRWSEPEGMAGVLDEIRRSDAEVVILMGGDGTVSQATNALAGGDKAIGVLPGGTFNWIAQDLGMPLSMDLAVQALADGRIVPVDAGDMDGRLFLHNVSLGLHTVTVRTRDEYRRKLGVNKAVAAAFALLRTAWHPPLLHGYLESEENAEFIRAPFVFIGMNRFDTESMAFLRRESLDDGRLSVFYAARFSRPARLRIFRMALYTIIKRRMKEVPELSSFWVPSLTLKSRKSRLKVVADGEMVDVETPIHFRVRHRYLRMVVPRNAA